ncbi:hypothetical protein IE81DRAFT_298049 [Ceraceosorus guamensis]|uniref:Uncharacterized protein n=1 Tax=Ceraceosorus guamensis TaxID=1522189 RepID=A0A316W5F7_9BASI|nr:hypothetical protein IE81DRAFT_298049 [Ceraceosorus guamensis]PWN44972.1 hypothetical protein IE81DRAFT_298049 [Ceraceosorus guamensis]
MPEELLNMPPAYCMVGAYRLAHDPLLWKPMWSRTSQAAKRAGAVAAGWAVVTWPVQRLFVSWFMKGSASVTGMASMYESTISTADRLDGSNDSSLLGFGMPSLTTFAAMMFVLGQCNTIMEFWLRRKLRECRNEAYAATVRSRGKGDDWWTPYFEEWAEPPLAKAEKNAKKQAIYMRLASPLIRIFVLKVVLLPLDFIPFMGLIASSVIRSLSMGRQLHSPLFAHKRMTPLQVELWVTERQFEYRLFGLTAALLESVPVVGLAFSISNRVGAAMYAFDLEKRQQSFRSGKRKPLPKEETYSLADPRRPVSGRLHADSPRRKLRLTPPAVLRAEQPYQLSAKQAARSSSRRRRICNARRSIQQGF